MQDALMKINGLSDLRSERSGEARQIPQGDRLILAQRLPVRELA